MRNETLRRALAGKLWYVHEQKMNEMLAFIELRLSGGIADSGTLASIRAARKVSAARARNLASGAGSAVAVIPVYGMLMHRGNMDISGPSSCSTESLLQQLRQAVNDPGVRSIVFDIDSPGGDVDGVDELATEIYQARKQKKISAVSNCLCASAAYYLASQATEVVASPSSLTGSIGVYTMHEDDSKALDNMGVKFTLIKFGENKAEGISTEPLSDSAREHLQEMVDTFGAMFEKAVARGRGLKQSEVHAKFGQGRVFDAKTAMRLGMVDRVATLDEVLQGYGVSRSGNGNSSAQLGSADSVTTLAMRKSDVGEPDDDINDAADDLPSDCSCPCDSCRAGDCSGCSCDGCDSETCAADDCSCGSASDARKKALAMERMRLEIAAA